MADSLAAELPLSGPMIEDQTAAAEPERAGINLKKRVLNPKTILSFVVAILLLYTVFKKLGDFSAAAQAIKGVSLGLYALAFVAYAMTFPMRGLRWHRLLHNVGEDKPVGEMTEYVFLSWFVNCLVPTKIGDLYRGYLAKKNDNVSMSKSVGTIFAERIIDTLVIF
ncbi:MAG: flippase-like domain-containing protein, partial [Chloroflexi bacterium]|nr:flippase-like domain-containing protein [Chloroflexota bacterium]